MIKNLPAIAGVMALPAVASAMNSGHLFGVVVAGAVGLCALLLLLGGAVLLVVWWVIKEVHWQAGRRFDQVDQVLKRRLGLVEGPSDEPAE